MRFENEALRQLDIHGALDFEAGPEGGLIPRRLPAWTRPQISPLMDIMCKMGSGVRMRFRTDSKLLRIGISTTCLEIIGLGRNPVSLCLEDETGHIEVRQIADGHALVVDLKDRDNMRVEAGNSSSLEFELPQAGEYQLWLPHNAFSEIHYLEFEEGSSLEPYQSDLPLWVHYGSSISHCLEVNKPTEIWPAIAAKRSNMQLHNLGFGGECQVDQFAARTIRDLEPDFISLKMGINVVNADSMRERCFASAVHGFLDTLRERLPHTPILLVSPIYCPSAENHPGPTIPDESMKFRTVPGMDDIRSGCLTLCRTRDVLAQVAETRRDSQLHYLDGLQLFGPEDAHDLPDDLHPNSAGYARIGERFAECVFAAGGVLETLQRRRSQ